MPAASGAASRIVVSKSSLVGSSVTVPFENGKLSLGRWQGIYLCEFDGARERKVLLKII